MDHRATLVALLELWASVADRELAAAIELISARAARSIHVPIATRAEWFAALGRNDVVERHHLLAALSEAKPADELARIEALAPLVGTDPRVDARIVEHLALPFARFAPASPNVALLVGSRDPRVVDVGIPRIEVVYKNQENRRRTVGLVLNKVRNAHAKRRDRALTTDERALIATVIADASRDAQMVESLLAAIYAAPFDDALRSIYADWLLERGDPRGEFIMLQLAATTRALEPDETKRVKDLVDAYAPVWLGSLAPMSAAIVFERGFIARCRRRIRTDDPRWGTLEECEHFPPPAAFRSLVRLRDCDAADIVRLRELPDDAPLAELTWQYPDPYKTDAIAAFEAAKLPALRRLFLLPGRDIWNPDEIDWMFAGRHLEHLALRGALLDLPRWIRAIEATTIRMLHLSDPPHDLTIERDGAILRLAFTTWTDYRDADIVLADIISGVGNVAPQRITSFTYVNRAVDGDPPARLAAELREALGDVKLEILRR